MQIKILNISLHYYFYLLLALFIPFGKFISVIIILLGLSIFFTQSFKTSIQLIKSRPFIYLFTALYLLYLLGMLYTSNISTGLKDIEYKLSLLVFPLIIGATPQLKKKQFHNILNAFVIGSVAASMFCLISVGVFSGVVHLPVYSELSCFLHTSYFSLYLNFCFVILIYNFSARQRPLSYKVVGISIFIFLFLINLLLSSKIGIILSMVIISFIAVKYIRKKSKIILAAYIIISSLIFYGAFQVIPGMKERFTYMVTAMFSSESSSENIESSQIRVLIWEQALEIFKENPLIGVGTGDAKDELMAKYHSENITMAFESRLNAHSQYFEWLVNFGAIGLIFSFSVLVIPMAKSFKNFNYLHGLFSLLILSSFAVESMLETQAGVVFYAFFNALLYFHSPSPPIKNSRKSAS